MMMQMEGYKKPVEADEVTMQKKSDNFAPAFKPLIYGELGKRQAFVAENFTLNMNRVRTENPSATGGTLQRLTTQNMPGLQDLSLSLKYLKPCSINFPSYHPRASELIYVRYKKVYLYFRHVEVYSVGHEVYYIIDLIKKKR